MRPPHIPYYDTRDPECPEGYDPEADWDRYLEECDREYEDRKCNE